MGWSGCYGVVAVKCSFQSRRREKERELNWLLLWIRENDLSKCAAIYNTCHVSWRETREPSNSTCSCPPHFPLPKPIRDGSYNSKPGTEMDPVTLFHVTRSGGRFLIPFPESPHRHKNQGYHVRQSKISIYSITKPRHNVAHTWHSGFARRSDETQIQLRESRSSTSQLGL